MIIKFKLITKKFANLEMLTFSLNRSYMRTYVIVLNRLSIDIYRESDHQNPCEIFIICTCIMKYVMVTSCVWHTKYLVKNPVKEVKLTTSQARLKRSKRNLEKNLILL